MVAVFCIMLFSGSLAITVLPDQKYSDLENRQLQQKPKLTKKNLPVPLLNAKPKYTRISRTKKQNLVECYKKYH
mgnify:CR=1 FL=1